MINTVDSIGRGELSYTTVAIVVATAICLNWSSHNTMDPIGQNLQVTK